MMDTDKMSHCLHVRNVLKTLLTAMIYAAFISVCFCRNLYGLILTDLALITGAPSARIGAIYMWIGAGGITGALVMGPLYTYVYPPVLLSILCVLLSGVTIILPWCAHNRVMVLMVMAAVQSFLYFGIAIGCNYLALRIWYKKSRSVLSAMHFLFTLAGVVLPLVSAPFLTDPPLQYQQQPRTLNNSNDVTSSTNHLHYDNSSARTSGRNLQSDERTTGSRIYGVFLGIGIYLSVVATGILIVIALSRLVIPVSRRNEALLFHTEQSLKQKHPPPISRQPSETSTDISILYTGTRFSYRTTLIIRALFMLASVFLGGKDVVFNGLVYTYAVQGLNMSVTMATLVLSINFVCYSIGRFASIFIIDRFALHRIIITSLIVTFLSTSLLSISDLWLSADSDRRVYILWISTCLAGVSFSPIFACLLLWADSMLRITPHFTSATIVANLIGITVWPTTAAYLMAQYSVTWFSHMNTLLSLAMVICCIILRYVQYVHEIESSLRESSEFKMPFVNEQNKHKPDVLLSRLHHDYSASLHSIHGI